MLGRAQSLCLGTFTVISSSHNFFPAFWISLERIFVSQDLGVSPKARNEESGLLFFENTTFSVQQQQQYRGLMIPKLSRIGSRIKITGRYSGNQEIYPPLVISSPSRSLLGPDGPIFAQNGPKNPKIQEKLPKKSLSLSTLRGLYCRAGRSHP